MFWSPRSLCPQLSVTRVWGKCPEPVSCVWNLAPRHSQLRCCVTSDVFCNLSAPLVPIFYTSRADGNLNELIWTRALKTAREYLLRAALAHVPRAAAAPPQAPATPMWTQGPSSLLSCRPDSGTNHTFAQVFMWLLGFFWPQVTGNLPQTDITKTRFLRAYRTEEYIAWFGCSGGEVSSGVSRSAWLLSVC